MPKISVHLECDTPEEFRALLTAFHVELPERWDSWKHEPKVELPAGDVTYKEEVQLRPEEPDVVNGEDLMNEKVGPTAETPKKPKRGRPFKTAPVEPAEAAQPTVTPQPVSPVEEPVSAVVETAAAPKVKTMPHAQPENGAATRQDLLDAFSEYVQRYGASFGFSDISSLLQKNLGDGVRKASDVPEDKLPVAIGAIKTAIADNPFNRKRDYA